MSVDVKYTTEATAHGGRDGHARTADGALEVKLTTPKELGGAGGEGNNPEQLFAAGYAACFASTLSVVAKAQGAALTGVAVDSEVDMLHEAGTFELAVRLLVHAKGVDRPTLEGIVEKAKAACPYSRATRNSISSTVRIAP